jgi:hypothetical protein
MQKKTPMTFTPLICLNKQRQMMLEEIQDYIDAGKAVMDMHPVVDGQCQCGNPECNAAYKHPKNKNWRTITTAYAEQSMSFWEDFTDFAPTSCGWILEDTDVVVDVDPRNGGMESLHKLEEHLGYKLVDKCNSVVNTGGGGLHYYFKKPDNVRVRKNLPDNDGIDIKSGGGFVVIAGSMHKSGNAYEWYSHSKSDLKNIAIMPSDLFEMCKAPEIDVSSQYTGADGENWRDALNHIDPDIDYEDWIRVGMAVHHITNGEGFEAWDDWSQSGDKYDASIMMFKWDSFGKSNNIVTEATLFHIAKEHGYIPSIGIPEVVLEAEAEATTSYTPIPVLSKSELSKPTGLLGDTVDFINSNSLFKRNWAAVGVAMSALGMVINQSRNTIYDTRFNMINIIVADSSTGKDSLISSARDILAAVDMEEVIYGKIKSEQEIYRNLIRHQPAFYMIDEFGLELGKIKNAHKNGTSYHEGTIATLLSAFTKPNKVLDVTGDLKHEMMTDIRKQITKSKKLIENGAIESDKIAFEEKRIALLEKDLERARKGIHEPYLSMCGFTTPTSFENSVDDNAILQGDVGRMLIFKEYDSNPMPDRKFKGRQSVPDGLKKRLKALCTSWDSAGDDGMSSNRIEFNGKIKHIDFANDEARHQYDSIYMWFYAELANKLKDDGMQAIARRSPELMNKVLGLLACEGSITVEHIQYAFSLVYHDIIDKKRIATITRGEFSKDSGERSQAMIEKIKAACSDEGGATPSAIFRKTGAYKREDVTKMVMKLVENGILDEKINGKSIRYTVL